MEIINEVSQDDKDLYTKYVKGKPFEPLLMKLEKEAKLVNILLAYTGLFNAVNLNLLMFNRSKL